MFSHFLLLDRTSIIIFNIFSLCFTANNQNLQPVKNTKKTLFTTIKNKQYEEEVF